jgi:GntR family transcriptional regulator
LNKDLPVPLYHQLKDVLLRGIQAGRWKLDDRLPPEDELAVQFEVSRITVRQALRELSNLGYIRREQGRGTFVRQPPVQQGPRELTSFTEDMRRRGAAARSRVLEHRAIPASDDLAVRLSIAEGEPVFRLRRLRLADGKPMGLQTSHVPLAFVPGIERIDFANASLYETLDTRYDLVPVRATETQLAVAVGSGEEAALLKVAPGSPALAAERVTYLPDGRPLEFVYSVMRGDRYSIVLDLVLDPNRRIPRGSR